MQFPTLFLVSHIAFMFIVSTYVADQKKRLLPHLRKDHRKLTKWVPHGSQNYPTRKYVFPYSLTQKNAKDKKVKGVPFLALMFFFFRCFHINFFWACLEGIDFPCFPFLKRWKSGTKNLQARGKKGTISRSL